MNISSEETVPRRTLTSNKPSGSFVEALLKTRLLLSSYQNRDGLSTDKLQDFLCDKFRNGPAGLPGDSQ
jgi:hypothetical protein